MELNVIPVDILSKEEYKKYSKLNLGDKGLMKYYLKSAFDKELPRLKYRRNETIISITNKGKVLAWVLLLESRNCSICRWRKFVHIYTRAPERNKGYAAILIQKTLDMTRPNKLYCRGNIKFFSKYGIKYA